MTIFSARNIIAALTLLAHFIHAAVSYGEEVRTPDPVYASVRITNPGYASGSGTIISRGPDDGWSAGISCAHLFVGKIGGEFIVDYPNGVRAKAILRRIDRSKDLSLFFVPTRSVIEVISVPKRMPATAKYHVCGYPQGEGPKFYGLVPDDHPSVTISGNMNRWVFRTQDGTHLWNGEKIVTQNQAQIIGGNSGCCIIGNMQLVSVLSHNGASLPGQGSPICYGCPHNEIVAFLNECRDEQKYCGDWFAEPAMPVPAPPPPPPAPEKGPFKPKPNIEVEPRGDDVSEDSSGLSDITPGKKGEGYDGHGRPPKGNRHPRERSANIDDLETRVYKLEELLSQGLPKGEKGEPGQDGQDYIRAPKAAHSPLHAILLGFLTIIAVVVVDDVRRSRAAAQ